MARKNGNGNGNENGGAIVQATPVEIIPAATPDMPIEAIQVPDFLGLGNDDGIFVPPVAYNVRNDCQIGQWKIGSEKQIGNSIAIAIVKLSKFFGSLGKTRGATWTQVWFVPVVAIDPQKIGQGEPPLPADTVCVTYLKTESAQNLMQLMTELRGTRSLLKGVFIGKFAPRKGELGNYAAIEWEWRDRSEEERLGLVKIANFIGTEAWENLTDDNLPATMFSIDGVRDEDLEQIRISVAQLDEERREKIAAAKS